MTNRAQTIRAMTISTATCLVAFPSMIMAYYLFT